MLVVKIEGDTADMVVFRSKELEVLIHALVVERQKVVVDQTNYGTITIEEFDVLINQFQKLRKGAH